uniref:Ig-like domain-containing protein n=1 Tax=Sinocyclocheilus grahami TaxID=75366 RepID=A0A672PDA9_SINGR
MCRCEGGFGIKEEEFGILIQDDLVTFARLLQSSVLLFGDEITADSTEESAAVGSTVTLSCSYSSAQSLQWYRQYPGSAPQFLVLIIESVKETKTSDVDPRFFTKLRKEKQDTKEIKHVDLIIFSAAVSDSALYYCALSH